MNFSSIFKHTNETITKNYTIIKTEKYEELIKKRMLTIRKYLFTTPLAMKSFDICRINFSPISSTRIINSTTFYKQYLQYVIFF